MTTFLDFIRKVHEERKQGYIQKGGEGSGWYAPPKGTHGIGNQTGTGNERVSFQVAVEFWFKSQPWTFSKEEIIAGKAPGISYEPENLNKGTLAANLQNRIAVGDTFFQKDVDIKRFTLYHEVGHSLGGAAFGKQGKFLDVIEPFRQDKHRPRSVRSTYDNFVGLSSRPEEFLADLYMDIIHNGKAGYESQKYHTVYDYVAKLAKQQGLPYQPLYRIKGGEWVRISTGKP